MSKTFGRTKAAALIAGAALGIGNAPVAVPTGKTHSVLQIKAGLWEFSDMAKVTGDTVFPEAMLARVPAGQRVGRLAELRRMLAQSSRERECMNQAVFEQRLFSLATGCTQTIASNTSGRLEAVTECRAQSGAFTQRSTRRLVVSSPAIATISMHAVSMQAGKTMIVDSVESGRWVSSSCGTVHGIQQLQ